VIRIGNSTDIHALKPGKSLNLGGIKIDSHVEAVGHSDADALLHSIAEALLGSLALGDLGSHFPDTDPRYKGMDSKVILKEVYAMVKNKGYRLVNLDSMVLLERPKLKPHIQAMQQVIAHLLEVDASFISIKATTGEKLGIIGREEAIMCQTTLLVEDTNTVQYL